MRIEVFFVLFATFVVIFFNWVAATGGFGETISDISEKYPTKITPANYAFSIWGLIYAGLLAFSIYQALPKNLTRLDLVRWFYLLSCAMNILWLYVWSKERILDSLFVIVLLLATLLLINRELKKTENSLDYWLVKFPFGIYFGWITVATIVNAAVVFSYFDLRLNDSLVSSVMIFLALIFAVVFRWRLKNYFYPLPIAWGLAAIAVKQSGEDTLIVVSSAIGVVVCLIASLSFVLEMPSTSNRL